MEFCSKYGLDYGFEGSDEENVSDNESNNQSEPQKNKIKLNRVRKADSNIIAVKFDQLVLPNHMFAGEPISCKKCEAIISNISKNNITNNIWRCEFCYEENNIESFNIDQIPNEGDVTYLVEPAPHVTTDSNEKSSKVLSNDNNYLFYCIDISGSMDTNIPIKDNQELNNNNNTYVNKQMNRLDGVKIACVENLSNLKSQEPNKRVGLVTFSNEVKYFADCTRNKNEPVLNIGEFYNRHSNFYQTPVPSRGLFGSIKTKANQFLSSFNKESEEKDERNQETEKEPEIPKDIMNNKEKMIALAQNQDSNLKPISESFKYLEQKIKNLRTEGSTALGPALVFSIGYTSKQSGSQIILCTDGCANVGMGAVENDPNSENFYDDLANYAKSKGVTVNIISMEGTDCKLALLGKVADLTNGTMNIVNPLNLSEEFKSILENRIIATEVKAKLIVNNKYLYIRDEDLEKAEAKAYESNDDKAKLELEKFKKSIFLKDIGNANIDTEITFEYGIRRLDENERQKSTPLKELPFQLQISYTQPDGAKALRVYTKIQEFTRDRQKAQENVISQDLVWSNYAQKMSNHVLSSNVSTAQYRAHQISNFQKASKWATPQLFSANVDMVYNLSASANSKNLSDKEATEMLKAKKMNRKFFK